MTSAMYVANGSLVPDNYVHVNGNILKDQALHFGKEMSLEEIQASDGWRHRWKLVMTLR